MVVQTASHLTVIRAGGTLAFNIMLQTRGDDVRSPGSGKLVRVRFCREKQYSS